MVLGGSSLSDALTARVQVPLSQFEESLRQEMHRYSDSSFYQPLLHALQGGKRIRPMILILAYECMDGAKDDLMPAAVAVELLHTESIIHDDIIDRQSIRRGRHAFHVKYGHSASVLTADFVFSMILLFVMRSGRRR